MADPESSAQALERYIASQLTQLHLVVPSDDVEYMARFIEEPEMEFGDKVEGVRGMLEGVVEGGVLPDGIDKVLEGMMEEWERLRMEEDDEEEEAKDPTPPPRPKPADLLATLSPEELAAAQRQALLRQYAYVEGGPENEHSERGGEDKEDKRAGEERRRLIEDALKLDAKRKKYRKQHEVDLLAPNLNKEKMNFKAQAEKEAQKKGSMERKERDRLALEKQRNDAAKAKVEKQQKAAKQERRA